jgi:hypothetical protein
LVTFFVQAKKVTRAPDARGKPNGRGYKRIKSKGAGFLTEAGMTS